MEKFVYHYQIEIIKVIDADTVDVVIDLGFNNFTKERIRLYGIDAHESYGKDASEKGKVAKNFTEDWLTGTDGKWRTDLKMQSVKYDHRGKYGRCIGAIYYTLNTGVDIFLHESLLDEGHAVKMDYK